MTERPSKNIPAFAADGLGSGNAGKFGESGVDVFDGIISPDDADTLSQKVQHLAEFHIQRTRAVQSGFTGGAKWRERSGLAALFACGVDSCHHTSQMSGRAGRFARSYAIPAARACQRAIAHHAHRVIFFDASPLPPLQRGEGDIYTKRGCAPLGLPFFTGGCSWNTALPAIDVK